MHEKLGFVGPILCRYFLHLLSLYAFNRAWILKESLLFKHLGFGFFLAAFPAQRFGYFHSPGFPASGASRYPVFRKQVSF